MYVDYRDLNKATPEDDFPLPDIEVLIDSQPSHILPHRQFFTGSNQTFMDLVHKVKMARGGPIAIRLYHLGYIT